MFILPSNVITLLTQSYKLTTELVTLLKDKINTYNNTEFIKSDPISIPHMFSKKEDIEISAFLTSVISWGRRTAIINSATKLMKLMDNAPYDFMINSTEKNLSVFNGFIYRTFNSDDCLFMISAMRDIYRNKGGLETIANNSFDGSILSVITGIRQSIIEMPHLHRSEKHLGNPLKGSAAKRTNMFLRWMIRNDNKGVDFGIWKNIPPSVLVCPLDVHSGNVARKLKLLSRKQNDWKAAIELTENLKNLNPNDPIAYDFALFGMGVFEGVS